MNFKTTIVLIVLLLGVGGYLYFTRGTDNPTDATRKIEEHKLVDVKRADVTRVVISSSDGKPVVLEKADTQWKLVQPVAAAAESVEVGGLLDSVLGLTSTAEVDPKAAGAPKTGLDTPQMTLELTAAGKVTKLLVGNKLGVSNSVYVRVDGQDKVQVVPADFIEKVDRPASELRQMKLVETISSDIKQITIIQTQKDTVLSLQKIGNDWQIIQPIKAQADSSAVTDLLSAISGLKAVAFVDSPSAGSGLDKPRATIFFSTVPPSTQPSTQPTSAPAGVTIAFGGFDGVLKKNLYVKLSDSTAVATVAATTLDSFNKTALDLRDKKVVDIDVAEINRFTLKTGNPATTSPTTKPARSSEITLERRSEVHTGPPMLPATQPIASTVFVPKWPVERSQWQVVSGGGTKVGGDADDIEVKAMLDAFHPLRADKYLGKPAPTTQPVANYSIHLSTVAAGGKKLEYDFKFVNPSTAQEQPLIGDHNGLSFETSRSLLTNLDSTFKKKPASATPPPMPGVPGQ